MKITEEFTGTIGFRAFTLGYTATAVMKTKWKRLNFSLVLADGPRVMERQREENGNWEGGEADGIAFVLVTSSELGNFGRWLVRGAQSGLPDLT